MVPAKPITRYRATRGARAFGFATSRQLHHLPGHDRRRPWKIRALVRLSSTGEQELEDTGLAFTKTVEDESPKRLFERLC